MDANTIRNVRREIKKTLGIKIDYENELFQMLKDAFIYIDNMPDEYNWILQKLLQIKKLVLLFQMNIMSWNRFTSKIFMFSWY